MRRRYDKIYSPAIGQEMEVLSFGHYGEPVIAFPSGGGSFFDFENNGMVEALAPLIEGGRIKLYCPPSLDHHSWLSADSELYWKEINHNKYQDFILSNLVEAIRFDCRSAEIKIGVTGCSLGAYHAANFALKYPSTFNYALCMSGRYDLERILGHATSSMDVYFNNPLAYATNFYGGILDSIRHETHLVLVCGQGAWEDKCLDETNKLASIFRDKGINHELDVWGHDVEHHWFWWRKQAAHHLGKRYG
ncbi:MAG: alpha/beta hydrolase-fold protein [Chloroflexota bacterium]